MIDQRWLLPMAILCSWAGTAAARGFARRLGIVNNPNPIVPQHTRPVAYLGGLGVALGIAGAVVLGDVDLGVASGSERRSSIPIELAVPGLLFLALGLVDDLRPLPAGRKFLVQALIAAGAVGFGVQAAWTGIDALDAALSWFWLVTLVNAFNLVDVCDGLASSLALVTLAFVAAVEPAGMPLASIAAGATAGFLAFNRPPASIFLGDAGSHLLGFLVGALVLRSPIATGAEGALSPIVAALLVAVPLFELIFLIVVRTRKGIPWWRGSPDHFALRMQAAGFTRGQTDLAAAGMALLMAAAAFLLPSLGMAQRGALLGAVVAVTAWSATRLLRWEVPPRAPAQPSIQTVEPAPATR